MPTRKPSLSLSLSNNVELTTLSFPVLSKRHNKALKSLFINAQLSQSKKSMTLSMKSLLMTLTKNLSLKLTKLIPIVLFSTGNVVDIMEHKHSDKDQRNSSNSLKE